MNTFPSLHLTPLSLPNREGRPPAPASASRAQRLRRGPPREHGARSCGAGRPAPSELGSGTSRLGARLGLKPPPWGSACKPEERGAWGPRCTRRRSRSGPGPRRLPPSAPPGALGADPAAQLGRALRAACGGSGRRSRARGPAGGLGPPGPGLPPTHGPPRRVPSRRERFLPPSLPDGSRPPAQLSKQGVSLSFWLTESQRGAGGLNACVWTQAIIPNYSFSFEPARPAGELAAEQAP